MVFTNLPHSDAAREKRIPHILLAGIVFIADIIAAQTGINEIPIPFSEPPQRLMDFMGWKGGEVSMVLRLFVSKTNYLCAAFSMWSMCGTWSM